MLESLKRGYTVPENGTTDCEAIQEAIDRAVVLGLNKTVIPRYNSLQDSFQWVVSEPVFVPSHFHLEIDNAEVCFQDTGCIVLKQGSKASDIHITGSGNAVLVSEAGGKCPLIQLRFAERVRISHLQFQDCVVGAITMQGVKNAGISHITFLRKDAKPSLGDRRKKPAGIIIGSGCKNVTVEHIFGRLMTSAVELNTCFPPLDDDSLPTVTDILVRNVRTDCFVFANVVLKNGDDGYLARVTVDGVIDASEPGVPYRAKAMVSIGGAPLGSVPSSLGQTRNMTIRNVVTRGACAVELLHSVMDMTISDITLLPEGSVALDCGVALEYNNIYLCNVKFDPRKVGPYPFHLQNSGEYITLSQTLGDDFYPYRAVCNMKDTTGVNFKINGVYADELDNLLRILGKNRVDVYDADILNIFYDDCVSDDCIMEQ